ncbi:tyrosine-type recombinase/integrase [Shewanella sp. UCD-KL12]|uniref:tyrosine-type recombinase/integrase n=1 Tax=Shewanella sp. UCD-KL12 TaxID=1917163 RepID=UPI000970B056|nr:tyrosine-type recombinase/integrase [Shewanella sp. UCD-KL12]
MSKLTQHLPNSFVSNNGHQQKLTEDNLFFEEQALPISILDDFKSAASETQYEISYNTRRAYQTSFNIFSRYCEQHGLNTLPADPRSVISFIGQQKELINQKTGAQLSKQTLTTRLAAIRFFHIQAGFHSPTEHPLVLRVMRGLSRNQLRVTSDYDQQPILYDELELLIQTIDNQKQTLTKARDKAIIQLGFQGGFRRSELASIQVSHVNFLRNKLKVRLAYSKSNQQGHKEWKDLPEAEPFSAMSAVKLWLDESQIKQGHLFRSLSRDGESLRPYFQAKSDLDQDAGVQKNSGFLRGDDIYQIIRKYCHKAGLSSDLYGAHSLRSGCVTQLHENDKDHLYIMGRTGHTDPRSLRHYLKPKD